MGAKFYIQLVCVILITGFFLWQFIRTKRPAQILIAVWAPVTLLSYIPAGKAFTYILGGIELVFFFAVIFFLFKGSKRGFTKNMLNDSEPPAAEARPGEVESGREESESGGEQEQ